MKVICVNYLCIVDKIDGNSTNKNKAKNVCYYEQKN